MAQGTAGWLTMAALLYGPLPETEEADALLPLIAKAILGSRPGTVRAQVASARVKLRERLAPFFEGGVRT